MAAQIGMAAANFDPGGWLRTFWDIQWFAGLMPVLILAPLLVAASREGKWSRLKTALWLALMIVWAFPIAVAQALAMWALQQRPPAIVVTADGIWCAPWPESAAWDGIKVLNTYDEKMRTGWKTLGITLAINGDSGLNLMPREYESNALRWGIRLAHWGLWSKPAHEIPCGTRGLGLDSQAAIRLVQEIHDKLGPRVRTKERPRNRCWVEHCLKRRVSTILASPTCRAIPQPNRALRASITSQPVLLRSPIHDFCASM